MSQAVALYHLQQIDLRLLRNHTRLKEIEIALKDNSTVTSAQAQVDAANQAITPVKTKIRDLELEIQSVTQKTKATEQRLYSGSVKNPKELQEMQEEIESLKRRNDTLEEQLLEMMLTLEDLQENLETEESNLSEVTQDWETQNSDLIAEKQDLEADSDAYKGKRKSALQNVSEESLKLYNTLRKRKANKPISALQDVSCTTCGIEQTMSIAQEVRHNQELVYCVNCGRILVDNRLVDGQ